MKNKHAIILLIIIALLSFIITTVILKKTSPDLVQTIPISATVGNVIGLNIDRDSLKFGTVFPGASATRKINITNSFKTPAQVILEITKIKTNSDNSKNPIPLNWISVPENDFILKPGEIKTIPITITTPKNSELKEYKGELKIKLNKIKNIKSQKIK